MATSLNNWTMTKNDLTGEYTLENNATQQNKTILVKTGAKIMSGDLRVTVNMASSALTANSNNGQTTILSVTPTSFPYYISISDGYIGACKIQINTESLEVYDGSFIYTIS